MRCVSHSGNKRLKRTVFPSAVTSLYSDPVNQAYYQHKSNPRQSALGQAVLTLAHRCIPTLHAATRNSTSTTHNQPQDYPQRLDTPPRSTPASPPPAKPGTMHSMIG